MSLEIAKKDLEDYMAGIKKDMPKISGNVAHMIASMLIGYRTGLYDRAIGRADKILGKIEKDESKSALKCAVSIIRAHSIELLPSQKSIRSEFNWEGNDPTKTFGVKLPDEKDCTFKPEDEKFYAIKLSKDEIKVPLEFKRDNALIFAYSTAYLFSIEDQRPLEEQVLGYVLQRIEYYQKEDA